MRKAIFPILSLLLLGASNLAGALTVTLITDNTRSGSGALSFQAFKTCDPAPANGCYAPTNSWYIDNGVTGSDATWDWNAATGVLTSTGTFWTTSFLSSTPTGTSVISDKTVNLVIDTQAQTTTATSYECVEGSFLINVGANGCLNTLIKDDFIDSSSALYNVGGDPNCVQRTIGGDDTSGGNPRGLFTADAVGVCDAVDGAYDLYTVVEDFTATGGTLIISNGIPLGTCLDFGCPAEEASAGAHWLTFAVVATEAVDDGPINLQQAVPTSIDVLANDTGFNDPVTVTIVTPPTLGTATVVGTSPGAQSGITIEYTSNAGVTGTDSFVYRVLDGDGTTSDTATVSVNVLALGANDDTATTERNSAAIEINVGANDLGFTDPVTLSITAAPDSGGTATPPAGTVTLADNGIITYTPATTPVGTPTYVETFTYQVTDANTQTDTAVVRVTVTNQVPDAMDGTVTISTQASDPIDKTGTFTAPGAGGSLGKSPSVVAVTSQGTKGIAEAVGNVITYKVTDGTFFSGTDTFTYTITDADSVTSSADVTVDIPDLTPSVVGDPSTSGNQDTVLSGSGAFTAGNGSVGNHELTIQTQATSGSCGTPTISGSNIVVAYTPNAGFVGSDSCVVRLADAEGDFDDGTYNFTVKAAGGGGGSGVSLPSSSGIDVWSLSLLAAVTWLRRRRLLMSGKTGDRNRG